METNCTIEIFRVENGYIVRSSYDAMNGRVETIREALVFQQKGGQHSTRDHQPEGETLFSWLDKHFT